MIEVIYGLVGFFIGYKIATWNVENIVKKEILRQLETLSDWTMKDEH